MSLNDPQWGRRPGPNQGPPDLEELWRRFNRKLDALFGRRGGGTGKNAEPGTVPPRRMGGGLGLLAMLVFIAWLASGFYIVRENERGVVLRFGRYI